MVGSLLYKKRCELLIREAKKWIGITEHGGDNKGTEVEMFQRAVNGKAQGEPWCLAFLMYCVKQVDIEIEKQFGGPNPPNWLFQTEHVMTLWNKMPSESKLNLPHLGCLVVWQHWKNNTPTSQGHIGIVSEVGIINKSIEGNTGPSSGVERDGDGVYEKIRSFKDAGNMKIRGFLTAWDHNYEHPNPDLLQLFQL